ncbi:Hsp90 cochaperone [Geranomyces michiganensis]|nr:Hsp90 cochaperone [Geranomyces michiganensis]
MTAEDFKTRGNQAFSAGAFEEAIQHFSAAIELDPKNHVLYSNRSASYSSLKNYEAALADATKTVELKPDWPRGYSRKGAALHGLGDLAEAAEAYKAGLAVDPNNAQLKKALEEVEGAASSANPFGNIFGPEGLAKIMSNPKVAGIISQPDVMAKIQEIQRNPENLNKYMQDPRIMTLMMAAMGLDATVANNAQDAQAAADAVRDGTDYTPPAPEPRRQEAPPPRQRQPEPAPSPAPEPELSEEEKEQKAKRAVSDAEKDAGNALYKQRKFDEAIARYDAAYQTDDTNIAVLTNKAAALYEAARFDECIKTCEEAVDRGRELRADYKIIAKAFARIGNAYMKKEDLVNAIKFFEKSLTEHRTPDTLAKLKEAERLRAVQEKESYRNPQLADEARERGNELFKQSNWPEAIKHYTEAIKRNDADPRNYSNRAACYIKLLALPEADKDCDAALKLDDKFIKAYIRKAAILHAKRDYMKCIDMCNEAKEKDTEGKHTAEIDGQIMKAYAGLNQVQSGSNREETLKRAMDDPEVQRTMADPVMQSILKQMQEDPRAAQDHLKNPAVAAKIRILVNAGIIQMR